jgi:DNA-binding response OmpR family regulator
VAEDEPAMLSLNAGFLRQKGFDVTEASDGEKAWTLAERGTFDLVLLDVMMPGMSGWEVCKRIKNTTSTRGTAVVMLTGIGETLNDMTSSLFSADAWLNKPYDFNELERKLREALGKFGKRMPDGGSDYYADNDEPPPSLPPEGFSPERDDLSDASGPSVHKAQARSAGPTTRRTPTAPAKKKRGAKKTSEPAGKKAAPAKKTAAPAEKKAAPKKAAPKKAAPKKAGPKKAAPKKKPAAKKPSPKKSAPKKSAKKAAKKPSRKR